MIALIRKNLRLWGYGKSLALFTGCILFSISGRLNGGIAYERHILSAVSDHYYLTYFVLPIVLLSCFSFIDDDGEPVILRFQSYHSYFLKKWIGGGLIAVILTAVQTGAILLSGIGLPLGNEWNLAAGATEAELFSTLEQLFASPLQAFVCFTLYQLILILDEPFNALDYKTYEDVKAIIRMLKAEGKTIFLTSHHYKDIEQLCDQVYSLEDCQLLPITEEIAARYREMD